MRENVAAPRKLSKDGRGGNDCNNDEGAVAVSVDKVPVRWRCIAKPVTGGHCSCLAGGAAVAVDNLTERFLLRVGSSAVADTRARASVTCHNNN